MLKAVLRNLQLGASFKLESFKFDSFKLRTVRSRYEVGLGSWSFPRTGSTFCTCTEQLCSSL